MCPLRSTREGSVAQECEVLGRLLMSGGSGQRKGKRGVHMKEKTGDFTQGGRGVGRGADSEKRRDSKVAPESG